MAKPRITADRLPAEVALLYAELVEQLTTLEAERSIGHADGSFVTKKVKGQVYYYFQHRQPGAKPRQIYVGRESPELNVLVARFAHERTAVRADRANIERLCALLRAGGAALTDAASARVTGALAEAAVFRLGGTLVGTHAFVVIANMLGVRWDRDLLRTQDIDIAGERSLAVAVPELSADVPAVLESLEMGFLPVPGLSPRHPSTSFKVRGRSLRVDLLTPEVARARGPVPFQRFRAAAGAAALPRLSAGGHAERRDDRRRRRARPGSASGTVCLAQTPRRDRTGGRLAGEEGEGPTSSRGAHRGTSRRSRRRFEGRTCSTLRSRCQMEARARERDRSCAESIPGNRGAAPIALKPMFR